MLTVSELTKPQTNQITGLVIQAAMEVHPALGPRLLKSAYEACLLHEVRKRGIAVASQVALPVMYDGVTIDLGYRIDPVIENSVVVELKCVEAFKPVHEAQILSYLKLQYSGRSSHQFPRGTSQRRHQRIRTG